MCFLCTSLSFLIHSSSSFLVIRSNLIDVSNVQADPLQTQDIQERQGRYQQILDNAKSGMSDQMHPSLEYSTVNATSPADLLASIRPNDDLSSKELDWLYKAMDDVHDAIRAIEVEPVGDVVVQLTMTENNSFGNHHAIRA